LTPVLTQRITYCNPYGGLQLGFELGPGAEQTLPFWPGLKFGLSANAAPATLVRAKRLPNRATATFFFMSHLLSFVQSKHKTDHLL
jgi:hypothetical protein